MTPDYKALIPELTARVYGYKKAGDPAYTWAEAEAYASTIVTRLLTPQPIADIVHHPVVPWIADAFTVSWEDASYALAGELTAPFGVERALHREGTTNVQVVFNLSVSTISSVGWSCVIEGFPFGMTFVVMQNPRTASFTLGGLTSPGDVVTISYDDALGGTTSDGVECAPVTDLLCDELP